MSNSDDKDFCLDEHAKQIEHSLECLGASAIEDKLQEGVPETIELLMRANIRVWVLTGDKQETAIEIGKSCNLITDEMDMLVLSSDTQADFDRLLNSKIDQFGIQD